MLADSQVKTQSKTLDIYLECRGKFWEGNVNLEVIRVQTAFKTMRLQENS